jgi:hypothetical protein
LPDFFHHVGRNGRVDVALVKDRNPAGVDLHAPLPPALVKLESLLDELSCDVLEPVAVPGKRGALESRLPELDVFRVAVADSAVVVAVGDAAAAAGYWRRAKRIGDHGSRPLTRLSDIGHGPVGGALVADVDVAVLLQVDALEVLQVYLKRIYNWRGLKGARTGN